MFVLADGREAAIVWLAPGEHPDSNPAAQQMIIEGNKHFTWAN